MPLMLAGSGAALLLPGWLAAAQAAQERAKAGADEEPEYHAPPVEIATARARQDLARLSAFVNAEISAGRLPPWNSRDLYGRFNAAHPGSDEPLDPFDGTRYGYETQDSEFFIWSVGPDGESWTADDLRFDSRSGN